MKYFLAIISLFFVKHIDGLVQERRNSSALAIELRLSCTNPLIYECKIFWVIIAINGMYY